MRDARWPRDHHEDERLSAFLDDELDDDAALEVTRHLSDCDRCLGELEELRAARSLLRGLPNLDPPQAIFSDAIAFASVERLRWSRTVRVASAALVGTALISAAAFAAGGDGGGTVVPPVELFVVDHVVRVGGGPMITPGRPRRTLPVIRRVLAGVALGAAGLSLGSGAEPTGHHGRGGRRPDATRVG